jgi:uncharacterized protein YqgC (DUF456 family)
MNTLLFGLGILSTIAGFILSWFLSLVGLPGNWLIVGIAAFYAYLTPDDSRWDISWQVVAVLAGLAVAGEIIETAMAAAGVKKLGGSRRGMVFALVGSFAGAIFGGGLGVPIPVIGPLVGVVIGACAGALGGAVLGELWKGRTFDESMNIGRAAAWGRLLGSMIKLIVGTAMLVVAVVALVM